MSANTTTAGKTTSTPAPAADRDDLYLAQFIHLDGGTFVHVCRSKDEAYQALADQEGLAVGEGQTAAEIVEDLFGDSDLTSYNVLPVDSTNLESGGGEMWLGQFIHLDGSTFVHVCRSKEQAYQALADQEGLDIGEGEAAEQAVCYEYEDSGDTTYVVAPVDSTNL
ncbi:MAG: hypothetical protein DI630_30215 [Gordonia sp. (in: high G+C Gram-positive bacteria)]|nr:MAG: hypothetical protein DI630_30215 [Gordonia sp. (in: high G+C Gram-positive bacteria)]